MKYNVPKLERKRGRGRSERRSFSTRKKQKHGQPRTCQKFVKTPVEQQRRNLFVFRTQTTAANSFFDPEKRFGKKAQGFVSGRRQTDGTNQATPPPRPRTNHRRGGPRPPGSVLFLTNSFTTKQDKIVYGLPWWKHNERWFLVLSSDIPNHREMKGF